LFPTLDYLFRPELVHNVTPWFLAVLFGLGMLGLLVEVKRGQPLTGKAGLALVTVCAAAFAANLAMGLLVAPLLCLGVFMVRRGSEPVYILLVLLLTGMLLAGLLLPARSTAASRGSSASGQAPEILDRRQVGLYDTITLSADEPDDLVRWLHDNGFAISSNALPVLADYTKRQWIFVAAKLMRTNAARQTESIHPLSFTFRSTEPVYPMRLTGVDGIPLSVDLYVFGPGTASAEGFAVKHSSRPEFPDPPNNWVYWKPKTLQIHSPTLRKWVNGAEVATKLTGMLSTSQQRKDVIIRWGPYYHKTTKEFSHAGAAVKSANTAAAGLLGGMILLGVFRLTSVRVSGAATWSLVIAVAVTGFATYVSSNKVPVRLTRAFDSRGNLMSLGMYLALTQTVEGFKEEVDFQMKEGEKYRGNVNSLLGGLIREQESPGNYILRDTGKDLEFVAYDAAGAPHVLQSVPKSVATSSVSVR
jgi:hypothetical protein